MKYLPDVGSGCLVGGVESLVSGGDGDGRRQDHVEEVCRQ